MDNTIKCKGHPRCNCINCFNKVFTGGITKITCDTSKWVIKDGEVYDENGMYLGEIENNA